MEGVGVVINARFIFSDGAIVETYNISYYRLGSMARFYSKLRGNALIIKSEIFQ